MTKSKAVELKEGLRAIAQAKGALFFGIANLTPAREFIIEQAGELPAKYPLGISVGYSLINGIVDGLKNQTNAGGLSSYFRHCYQVVSPRLDDIALDIAQEIQCAGHGALAVPSTDMYNKKRLSGLISHKLVAHLAGLGWIGKSVNLITPERGPRVRWCTILTDAPLEADQPFEGDKCGACKLCVENCPSHAITGTAFDVSHPHSQLYAGEKCWDRHKEQEKATGISECGTCVFVCPYGRKRAVQL